MSYLISAAARRLRRDMMASDAALGGALMTVDPAVSYPPGPTVANGIKNYITPQMIPGCPTDGISDATAYVLAAAAALGTGKKELIIDRDYVVDGNIPLLSGARMRGEGRLIKRPGTIRPILLLADSAQDVLIEGVRFDGSRASYAIGNAVPAILGHLCEWVRVHHCKFENVIDVGVKLRNCSGLELIGGRFFNIGENGVEIKNYDIDVRTGLPYVAALPAVQGGHKITKATFAKIDNGSGDGSGDGCGILISSDELYPVKGSSTVDCDFHNVKRGIWLENNDAGGEVEDFLAAENRFRGDFAGYGGDVYQAIGFIGVKRAKAVNNSIINVGNMDVALPGDSCNGIVVSGVADEVEISGNTIIDNTGNAHRMDYAIRLTAGTNLRVFGNTVQGASQSPIHVESANVTGLLCHSNVGAQDSYSWGHTVSVDFAVQNIPGTATTALRPVGYPDGTELTFPMPVRAVGVSAKLSAAINAGTVSFRTYTNGVQRASLSVSTADFGAGTTGVKTIGVTSGQTVPAGAPVTMDVDSALFGPANTDAIVTLTLDTGFKE